MQNEMQNSLATPQPDLQPRRRLLDRVRNQRRLLHDSIRTESAYVDKKANGINPIRLSVPLFQQTSTRETTSTIGSKILPLRFRAIPNLTHLIGRRGDVAAHSRQLHAEWSMSSSPFTFPR